jgi:hypothetical protein
VVFFFTAIKFFYFFLKNFNYICNIYHKFSTTLKKIKKIMVKKLVSFDFDGTLIHTPTPESGKEHWEKTTGLSWQGRGWWGNAESLNTNVFHPPLNRYTS